MVVQNKQDLRLAVNLTSKEPYVTLSHCWGSVQPLRLTLANYGQLQTAITYTSLPKTFQDAVTATRALGWRYLWIDSLCIIQDSKEDWEEQCIKMGQIYSGSIVTIAGPAAADPNAGFLQPRAAPRQLTLEIDNGMESGEVTLCHDHTHCGHGFRPYGFEPEQNSPLARRAWVLQERILSPRVLYFGSSNTYFECFNNVRFGNCHVPVVWTLPSEGLLPKKVIGQLKDNDGERFDYWLHIIAEYGKKLITNPKDKLPALSALASNFHKVTSCHYLAGSWQEDLYRTLTWQSIDDNRPVPSTRPATQEYIAPSWSWAAAMHTFRFWNLNYTSRLINDMEIIEAHVKVSGIDPFGQVDDGYLRIRGRSRYAVIKTSQSAAAQQGLNVHSEDLASDRLGEYTADDGSTMTPFDTRLLLLYLGWYEAGHRSVPEARQPIALAIKRLESKQNAFIRVGLVHVTTGPVEGQIYPLHAYFGDVEREELLIY